MQELDLLPDVQAGLTCATRNRSGNLSGSVLMQLIPTLADIQGLQLFGPSSRIPPEPCRGISHGNTDCSITGKSSYKAVPRQ